jgi:hypothetical protein
MTALDDDNARLIAWARSFRVTVPGHAITRAEHDALMADRDRPLTQSPVDRHHKGGAHNQQGDFT